MSSDEMNKCPVPVSTTRTSFVTPVSVVLLGTCVFSAAAILTGSLHYKASEKKLLEEGVAPSARRAALPLAARALAASTLGCATLGGLVAFGYTLLGGEYSKNLAVASWDDVVQSAKSGGYFSLVPRKTRPDRHTHTHTRPSTLTHAPIVRC
jgi:hypothetical protein